MPMGSKSETGHAVNAGNFSRMIYEAENHGTNYAPPETSISIVNLKLAETAINDAMDLLKEKAAPWMAAVNEREAVMQPVNKLITRIKNEVAVCAVSAQFIADVTSISKEIQGVRATPKIVTEPKDPQTPTDESVKQISAAQTGIDNKIDNVKMLYQMLKIETGYTPTETELKLAAILALITDMEAKNKAVGLSAPPMHTAMNGRNAVMYSATGNGAELSGKVKKYMKAKFGGDSVEYHDMCKYEYKKLVKE